MRPNNPSQGWTSHIYNHLIQMRSSHKSSKPPIIFTTTTTTNLCNRSSLLSYHNYAPICLLAIDGYSRINLGLIKSTALAYSVVHHIQQLIAASITLALRLSNDDYTIFLVKITRMSCRSKGLQYIMIARISASVFCLLNRFFIWYIVYVFSLCANIICLRDEHNQSNALLLQS